MKKFMQKLKKLQNNKLTFNVVIIYGTVAVGKFTVASELQKLINYKFFHNHQVHDIARDLFDRDTFHLAHLFESMNSLIIKEISEAKINVITTHAYSSESVSKTGLSDPDYMKKIESIIEERAGQACFVHLTADVKEILKRVSGESRINSRKLKSKKILKEVLQKYDWKTVAPVKNNLQIDNTNLSPKKVAQIIIEHFKL